MKVKEESEKVGLKLNIQKTKIMASCPITSWDIDGETVSDFFLGGGGRGSKITADGDCSHEIKNAYSWKKSYDQPAAAAAAAKSLQSCPTLCDPIDGSPLGSSVSLLKSRDITLSTKVCLVKAMFFPAVMYECESWTIKKAEH